MRIQRAHSSTTILTTCVNVNGVPYDRVRQRQGGRPVGLAKTGGRKKGTPNRSTLLLREKLVALGCDPVEELVRMARESGADTVLKVNIYSLFLRYTHPVPKPGNSNEDATADDSTITLNDAIKLAQYVLDRFGPDAAKRENQTLENDGETNPSNAE